MTGIVTREGDLLKAKGIIVHGCNARGVMGSGVAKQIRAKWPLAWTAYRAKYETFGKLRLGDAQIVPVEEGVWVVNGITQDAYGQDGKRYVDYEAVKMVFERVKTWARLHDTRVHFPLIGCGLAGGDWNVVAPIIEEAIGPDIRKVLWVQQSQA